jgi:hypothetical protein
MRLRSLPTLLKGFWLSGVLPVLKDLRLFWIPLANVIVLAITAYWIVQSTEETRRIREDAYQQRIDSFRPIVTFEVADADDYKLALKNIGKGPALDAELRISQILLNGGLTNLQNLLVREDERNLINLGEGQRVPLGGADILRKYALALDPSMKWGQPGVFAVVCTYSDINRLPYYTIAIVRTIENGPVRKLVLKNTRTASYTSGTIERLNVSDWAR